MKKLFSSLLIAALVLSLFSVSAFADSNPFSKYSDKELRELYDAVREEMIARGLPLAQEITLREGKFIVGEDILPGTYTIKCLSTSGETYGDMYSALGGMMSDVINAEVEILGDYGTVLKSFELKAGDSVRITLSDGTALQITDGTCVLTADS